MKKVLYVEDNRILKQAMLAVLFADRPEYEVLSADCVEEAKKLLDRHDFGFAIIDWRIPFDSYGKPSPACGFRLAHLISDKKIPFVVLSSMPPSRQALSDTTVVDTITKDWDPRTNMKQLIISFLDIYIGTEETIRG